MIGDNIKKFRQMKNLKQQELGDQLGVSAAMISQWERGERNPKPDNLNKLSIKLGIDLKELTMGCYIFEYWLKRFREDKGMTVEEFANAVDIPVDIYKTIEADEDSPTDEELAKIRAFIGEIPPDVMVGIRGNNRRKHDAKENYLLNMYHGLNDDGQDKALESVELLTKVPEYKK